MTQGAATIAMFKRHGWRIGLTQRCIRPPRRRPIFVDLFGMFDRLAFRPDYPGVVAIQETTASNLASRIRKVRDIDKVARWSSPFRQIVVLGWKSTGRDRIVRGVLASGAIPGSSVMLDITGTPDAVMSAFGFSISTKGDRTQ